MPLDCLLLKWLKCSSVSCACFTTATEVREGEEVSGCFFLIFIYFIYLFLAVLGLCCCAQAFSSCDDRGLLFIVVHGLLIAVASVVAKHRL